MQKEEEERNRKKKRNRVISQKKCKGKSVPVVAS